MPSCSGRYTGRSGDSASSTPGDEGRVAVDVTPDLEHRGLAVSAGERGQIGLRHHHGDIDGAPGEAFVAEDRAELLGERGYGIVVQDHVGHVGLLPIAQTSLRTCVKDAPAARVTPASSHSSDVPRAPRPAAPGQWQNV